MDDRRPPPHSVEAEQAVIGGLMLVEEKFVDVASFLTEADFFRKDHQMIWRAMAEMAATSQPFDPVTLGEWFDSNGISDLVGGSSYILEIANTTPSAANVLAYAEIVHEKANLRRLMDIASDILTACRTEKGRHSREISAAGASQCLQLSTGHASRSARSMKEIGVEWWNRFCDRFDKPGMIGIPTPWAKFNALTDGLQDENLVILAGRPSMGKSAVAMNIALCAASQKKRVMVFSLEMNDNALYSMAMAVLSDVVTRSWLRKPHSGDDLTPYVRAEQLRLDNLPMVIDDISGLTIDQIILRAKREHMREPLRLVVIDHLHIIPLPGKTKESTEIGDITRKCMGLAKALKCPVLLLSQLNRGLEARANKRPNMGDLRESGAIEQDADVIVFVYRDEYYARQEGRSSDYPGTIELEIVKQREGNLGRVWGRFVGAHGRIDDMDHEPEPPRRDDPIKTSRARKAYADRKDHA